ncbi:MAG: hypothetical protein JW787_05615 [Sedimentisphaerales bacterium]|nr:hypothetical protein [Sedimentisphaerales bacterium]
MKKKKTKKSQIDLQKVRLNAQLEKSVDTILNLLEPFCAKYLNEEYWALCHDMTIEIYDSGAPLDQGKPESWASGIVHAIGMVNFLDDPSFSPYMKSSQIADVFGVSQNTMLSKSKQIRDELDIFPMDPEWCLDSLLADNPLVWMFEVDGMIVDIRDAPREVQEQACKDGLIPFIPADFRQEEKPRHKKENKIKIIEFPSGKNKNKPEPVSEQKDTNPTLFDKSKD